MVPSALVPILTLEDEVNCDSENGKRQDSRSREKLTSNPNTFGLYREYPAGIISFPLHDPEDEQRPQDFFEIESLQQLLTSSESPLIPESTSLGSTSVESPSSLEVDGVEHQELWPYPNKSSFLLGSWYWGDKSQKSRQDFADLVKIITDKDFSASDIGKTSWNSINKALGGQHPGVNISHPFDDAGWNQDNVRIQVPFHSLTGAPGVRDHDVGTFFYRDIIDILKEKVSGPDFNHFHLEPHRLLWQKPSRSGNPSETPTPAQQVYGELYHSQAFLEAHQEIQQAPSKPLDCDLPRAVAALMFASDETHLTQFGETKLWPLYMFFGNESKYRRCQPSLHTCSHVAYFIKVKKLCYYS
jgi:hypothetical protein